MAHFAELDDVNTVLRVIVVADEYEDDGEQWCADLLGGRWKQTSYHGRIRVRYAGVGYTYDETLDAFIGPQPYPSWTLDPDTTDWIAPAPLPDDGRSYRWNEETLAWDLVPQL